MSRELHQAAQMALDALTADDHLSDYAAITALRAALAQPEPAPAVPNDAALNTLAKMFHSGEEIEGDNGAAMMVDMALWHEASEAFDSMIGEGDGETLAAAPAPAVTAPEIDVRRVMLGVVPGVDGMGHEVYAKSVDDVVNKLSSMGQELEDWQLGIRRLPAAPAPAVPLTDDMVEAEFVSRGDDKGQGLHPYWKDAFREGFNFARSQLSAAPAVPAVCDGGTCGLGGYCANCPRQAAAPAVPVSWDRLRVLMDGIPTREEFIGGQRQQYVAKEAVMSWLHEGQLRAKREAVQPAAPTVQVVLRQPNLFASAPAVREPQDERAAFEAWIRKDSGDLTTFGSGSNMHYRNSAVNNAWTGWQARAHGIGGGGK